MPLQFEPKTKNQLAEERLLPAGEYQFLVLEAKETRNREAKTVIEMRVRVGSGSQSRTIRDWLTPNYMEKVRAFCEVSGLEKEYTTGRLTAALVSGKAGWCRVSIEEAKGTQPRRNMIGAYMRPPRASSAAGR